MQVATPPDLEQSITPVSSVPNLSQLATASNDQYRRYALDKKQLSEAGIRSKFIDPAIVKAGWSETSQIYREYTIAPGRIVVRG